MKKFVKFESSIYAVRQTRTCASKAHGSLVLVRATSERWRGVRSPILKVEV